MLSTTNFYPMQPMLPQQYVVFLLAIVSTVTPACQRESAGSQGATAQSGAGASEPGRAVGWRVNGATEIIQAGAIRTIPAGREDALMAVLPNAFRDAATTCNSQRGLPLTGSMVPFAIQNTATSGFAVTAAPPQDPFLRCIVDTLAATGHSPLAVTMTVQVQLQFRR